MDFSIILDQVDYKRRHDPAKVLKHSPIPI
jgi:hypothetical protein